MAFGSPLFACRSEMYHQVFVLKMAAAQGARQSSSCASAGGEPAGSCRAAGAAPQRGLQQSGRHPQNAGTPPWLADRAHAGSAAGPPNACIGTCSVLACKDDRALMSLDCVLARLSSIEQLQPLPLACSDLHHST